MKVTRRQALTILTSTVPALRFAHGQDAVATAVASHLNRIFRTLGGRTTIIRVVRDHPSRLKDYNDLTVAEHVL